MRRGRSNWHFISLGDLRKNISKFSFLTSYYDRRHSKAYIWVLGEDGKTYYTYQYFVPYCFRIDQIEPNSELRDPTTLLPVSKIVFKTYKEWKEFDSNCTDPKVLEDGHGSWPEMQWVQDFWLDIRPWDRKILPADLTFFDIEVDSPIGVPDPLRADFPVVMISLWRSSWDVNDKVVVLGLKEEELESDWFIYVKCKDERDLFRKFISLIKGTHILSGWNSERFDIPYICKRAERLGLLGKLFSIGKFPDLARVEEGLSKDLFIGGEKRRILKLKIPGVAHLDYLKMVKRLTYGKNYPSFKLGVIGELELGEGKVEVVSEGISSLGDLYRKNFKKFIEYSAKDTWILVKLEEKFRLFGLIRALGSMSLADPESCLETPSKVIEGVLYHYYRKSGYCLPKRNTTEGSSYPGAYVKTPIRSVAEDIIYFDLASSYPSHQIVLNISPEVWLGEIKVDNYKPEDLSPNIDPYKIFSSYEKVPVKMRDGIKEYEWEFLERLRKEKKISISPDGSIWDRTRRGILPMMLEDGFYERKKVKKQMFEAEKAGDMNRRESLYILQWGIKTLLNSTYGICGSTGTRLSHIPTASAVTTSGKFTIFRGEEKLNEFFNNKELWKNVVEEFDGEIPEEWRERDWIITMDTDSLISSLDHLVKKCFPNWKGWTENREKLLDSLGKKAIGYVCDYFDEVLKKEIYSSESKHPIQLDFEIIAQKGIFFARKKYMLRVRVQDGIKKDKIKNTGVDFIKSNTPRVVKEKLETLAKYILSDEYSDEGVSNLVSRLYEELKGEPIENLSIPVSTAAYRKVADMIRDLHPCERERKKLGLPINAKAILNYNWLARYIQDKKGKAVGEIRDDEVRIFYFYVRPNIHCIDVLGYGESQLGVPKEMLEEVEPDIEKQLEKVFMKKAEILLTPLGVQPIIGDYFNPFC